MKVPVPIYYEVDKEKFIKRIHPNRHPAILRGVDIGTCSQLWTSDYLQKKLGNVPVKVHVSKEEKMDFINKNFTYQTLPINELIKRASSSNHEEFFLEPTEYYYLRSLGFDPRGQEVADIKKQFPNIADEIKIPPFFNEDRFFSSVFRIGSPGIQLWTHYDVMDNLLIQVCGKKQMVLYSPSQALNMYLTGDKSKVLDIDNPDKEMFPKFLNAERHECLMEPGDILFIPALWFHNAKALDFGIAVNVFWKNLHSDLYNKKDPYGNKDLIPAARNFQALDSSIKSLTVLPPEYKDFYLRRMISYLESHLNE